MPGAARREFNQQDFKIAQVISKKYLEKKKNITVDWIANQLEEIGLETYVHSSYSVYSILRAPKSLGTESLLITTHFNKKGFYFFINFYKKKNNFFIK